jgi:2-keto-4-pentenoate hydratase
VPEVHPAVVAAERAQLRERRRLLAEGAEHVGWKVGLEIPEARELIGGEPVFGHLTSATRFQSGAVFDASTIRELQVDCELALELGRDVAGGEDPGSVEDAIAGIGTGLELCDVGRPPNDFHAIVAGNVFHRAYALGPTSPFRADEIVAGRVHVNGELRYEATGTTNVADRIVAIARLLESVGEGLRAGDRIICGSICGGPLDRGDEIEVAAGDLGSLRVVID